MNTRETDAQLRKRYSVPLEEQPEAGCDLPHWLQENPIGDANRRTSVWLLEVGPSFVRPGRELPGTGRQLPCKAYPTDGSWPASNWARQSPRVLG